MREVIDKWYDGIYRKDVFFSDPIAPTADARELFIGREAERKRLRRYIQSSGFSLIEGDAGTGKTSLINAVVFELIDDYLNARHDAIFLLCGSRPESPPLPPNPAYEVFQVTDIVSARQFINDVYYKIALTLCYWASELKKSGRASSLPVNPLSRWLNSPVFESFNISIGNFSAGKNITINDSVGFAEHGLTTRTRDMLHSMFPGSEGGGIICVLDNLQLATGNGRLQILNELRDSLFRDPGLRWVFSGLPHTIRFMLRNSHLRGFEAGTPIVVKPVYDPQFLKSIIFARQRYFSINESSLYLPFPENAIATASELHEGNLRLALNYLMNYCNDLDHLPENESEKKAQWDKYYLDDCRRVYEEVKENWKTVVKVTLAFRSCLPILRAIAELDRPIQRNQLRTINSLKRFRIGDNHLAALRSMDLLRSSRPDDAVDGRVREYVLSPRGKQIVTILQKAKWDDEDDAIGADD